MAEADFRLAAITLDERSIVRRTREIEQERDIAIYDLLEANSFRPEGSHGGPYNLVLGVEENRLTFDIGLADGTPHGKVMLSLTPFRRVIKDYFLICESYFKAIRYAPPSQIEALDVGRRGLHDEGSALLRERLKGKIDIDHDTARRIFTLSCVLHLKVDAMRGPHGEELPGAILFACTMNAVRSVMAYAIMKHLFGKFVYVDAAGVKAGELDPMTVEVMEEIGIEIGKYHPKTFEDMEDSSMFDLCVTLSPEAQHRAVELAHTSAIEIEYWPTFDPTMVEGNRDQRLDAYRAVRDGILTRIKDRFSEKQASDT